jgi:hypothetical protein
MEETNYNLGVRPDTAEMFNAGIAYVVIPSDVDRSVYIRECFKTSTVSIFSEFNGLSNRVPVDLFTLNFIEFPELQNQFGSALSFIIDGVHKKPIITGLYRKQDELCDIKEHQFKFKREFKGNVVEIVGSPDGKYLGINVSSDKGGEVFLNVRSKDASGKININVDGDCNVTALNNTTLKQFGTLSLLTVNRDNTDEATIEEHTSTSRTIFTKEMENNVDKFSINNGDQPFVLGQLFKKYLKDMIQEIANATVTTQLGEMPLLNKAKIMEYVKDEKINDFLSKIAFLDE